MATIASMAPAEERDEGLETLCKSRLRVPRKNLIGRPRLLSLLQKAGDFRVALLQAPAGYGKTSLMQQWADHCSAAGHDIVWLSLDARDCDPMFFARHLERAIEESASSPSPAAADGPTQSYYGWRALLESICNRFFDSSRTCWIFLDDAHCLSSSQAAEGMRLLVESTPAQLHFIIGTRGDPGIPLGRLRAHDDIVELGIDDLRFEEAETLAFLQALKGLDLEADHVGLLQERAEGWIVGIKLFSLAMALEPENRHILESLSGERRQIADFFLEDVLSRQPDELQDFLLRISLLDEFCPSMCDATLGITNGRELIDRCEAEGLFLQERDQSRTWYRFHQLFAEFLRRQLQDRMPTEAPAIYRRAADWLTDHGNQIAAFDYAMKGQDPIQAGRILDSHCDRMFAIGLQPTVQVMAARLPPHILALYPRLMLSIAWRIAAQWRLQEARSLVAVAQQRVEEMAQSPENQDLADWLRMAIIHRETMIMQAAYQIEELEARAARALQTRHQLDDEPYLMGSFHNSLQFAQREQFKLSKIEQLDRSARELVERTGARQGEIFIAAITGTSLILMGQTDRARTLLEDNLRLAQRIAGRDDPLGSVVAVHLAALHYETNALDDAQALLDQYLPTMTSAGFVEQLVAGWVTQARLHYVRGREDSCLAILEEAAEFGRRYDLDRLRISANAEQLRVMLKLGRPDDAMRFARRRGLVNYHPASHLHGQIKYTALDSVVALSQCRLLAADDRFGEALALAHQWRSFVNASQANAATVEWSVLVAELLLLSGERLAAQRVMLQALRKAAPSSLLRRFLDEGEPIAGLLRQMASTSTATDKVDEAFLHELVSNLDPIANEAEDGEAFDDEAMVVMGRVTSRELEILTMAGDGLLNRQIGEQLGLTEGTVKWYLQQVYDKIGVRSRKQAFVRARQLGLIN